MVKTARCKDTGQNCDFIIRGDTEEELLANAAQHGTDAFSNLLPVHAPGLAGGVEGCLEVEGVRRRAVVVQVF